MILDSAARVLPKGWKELSLNNACELITDGSHFSPATTETGYPYITVRDLNDSGIDFNNCKYISEKSYEELTKNGCRPQKNDVLFSKDGTVGKVALIETDIDFVVLSSLAILRPNKSVVDSRFLRLAMQSPAVLESALGMKTGTALRRIVLRNLKTVAINVPPLEEQLKIVEILEEQLSRLDAALASLRAVREKSARFRRSLLQSAFNGALTGHDPATGVLPNDWQCSRLDEVAKVQLGRQRSPKHHTGPSMRPYLRAANVTWKGLDVSDVSEMNFTDEEMETYLLKDGDILVNEASGSASEVGKAVVFRGEIEDCGFQNHLIRVRVTSVNPSYLYQFLVKNAVLGEYLRESQGVGINHLGKTKLASWPVPIPSLKEQMRIVEILEEQLSRLDASLEIADVIEKKALAFRRSLLQAAFSGNLTKEWREGAHV